MVQTFREDILKLYVASSRKNVHYPALLSQLVAHGHFVWDWRNPPTGGHGFTWQECSIPYEAGEKWHPETWRRALGHPIAQAGFASDLTGMNWCDAGILLHPCGNSANLEAGWLAGRGKKVHVFCPVDVVPDLMVLALNGGIFSTLDELLEVLK